MDLLERKASDQKSWSGFYQRNAPLNSIPWMHRDLCDLASQFSIRILLKERTLNHFETQASLLTSTYAKLVILLMV